VLLVDADVVRPSVPQRLGVRADKGLLDVLMDPALDVADVVLQTNVPKLSILAAGTRSDRATEWLASKAMDRLLGTLAERYPGHVIVFDAPPLVLTNEAKVLASRVGQVVLVVEASKTPRDLVAQAFAAVEQCPVVLSVLNKAPESATPHGYGYYYG
jgi:receptor protein-tyrosine kinase